MINRVVLTGRLTRNPELKTTQNGLSVASFTIAVNRQFTDANGNRGADFINCVIWRKSAENLCNFTHKGSLIGIDGRLRRNDDGLSQGMDRLKCVGNAVMPQQILPIFQAIVEIEKGR